MKIERENGTDDIRFMFRFLNLKKVVMFQTSW